MPNKDGWTMDREHEKITLGKKNYRNMEEWSRPCAVCGAKFFIYTQAKASNINSSFGLKTCAAHRGQRPGAVQGLPDPNEFERLRTANANMTQELAELHPYNKELFEEVQRLKARLATYELQGAMEAQAERPPGPDYSHLPLATRMFGDVDAQAFTGVWQGPPSNQHSDLPPYTPTGVCCEPVQNTTNGALSKMPWEA